MSVRHHHDSDLLLLVLLLFPVLLRDGVHDDGDHEQRQEWMRTVGRDGELRIFTRDE